MPSYSGSGTMIIRGNFVCATNYAFNAGVTSAVQNEAAIFSSLPAGATDTTALQNTSTPCCTATFPTTLQLQHNLNKITTFSRFLKANAFTLPGIIVPGVTTNSIKMSYSDHTQTWKGNLHYVGLSPDSSDPQDTWDIVFEFGCVGNIGVTHLTNLSWRFSMRIVNTLLGEAISSRLLVVFPAGTVCSTPDAFTGFSFIFDTNALLTTPAGSVVFHDNQGLFSDSPGFIADPDLDINITIAQGSVFNRAFYYSLDAPFKLSISLPEST